MRCTGRFTLVELMIVVAIIGILGAIAIPAFHEYQIKAKLAEIPVNIDGIHKAGQAVHADSGNYLECWSAAPSSAPGKGARPFTDAASNCLRNGGFIPDGYVRASYRSAATPTSGTGDGCTDCNMFNAYFPGGDGCAYALEDVDGAGDSKWFGASWARSTVAEVSCAGAGPAS